MLPNPVCFADHPEVRARAGSLRAFLCAGATLRCMRTPFPTGSEGQPGHAITRQGLLDRKLASQSIESLRDFARESASSSPMRQSGPFSARAWPRRRRDAVLLLCPCYFARAYRAKPRKMGLAAGVRIVFSLLLTMGGHWTAAPFGETGKTAAFRARYSAAVCRRPSCRSERSTHSRVSFSCTPFWARRARRLSKSTRSRS